MRNYTIYRTGEPPFRIDGELIHQAENGFHLLRVFAKRPDGFACHIEWKHAKGWHWAKLAQKPATAAYWFLDHQPLDYTFGEDMTRRQIADAYRLLAEKIAAAIYNFSDKGCDRGTDY